MSTAPDLCLDLATGMRRGRRATQEDAVLGDLAEGAREGTIVLADGCGGHARGDLASNIAAEVALRAFARTPGTAPDRLREAATAANLAVYARAEGDPDLAGMSTTLLLLHVARGHLHWASVGDSPLWLFREGRLRRLNATHSLARHLDLLVEMGELSPEQAAAHPARDCLTAALGGVELEEMDCPDRPLRLAPGDIVLAASDGVLTLRESVIAGALAAAQAPPEALVARLLDAVAAAGDPEQDNTSVVVLRASPDRPSRRGRGTGGSKAGARRPRALAMVAEALRVGGAP